MKVLLLNGSPHPHGNTALALAELEKTFAENGVETEIIQVGSKAVRGCMGCGGCHSTGKCVIDDIVNETAQKLRTSQYHCLPSVHLLPLNRKGTKTLYHTYL